MRLKPNPWKGLITHDGLNSDAAEPWLPCHCKPEPNTFACNAPSAQSKFCTRLGWFAWLEKMLEEPCVDPVYLLLELGVVAHFRVCSAVCQLYRAA